MNKYEKEARVYPAIVGMIIPIILTTLYVTSFIPDTLDVWKSIIAKIGLFIPVALIYGALAYWVRQLFIDASKQLFQFRLLRKMKQKCLQQNFFFGVALSENLKRI